MTRPMLIFLDIDLKFVVIMHDTIKNAMHEYFLGVVWKFFITGLNQFR